MRKSKATDEQIVFALRQAETSTPVEEICRKMGIFDATFYNWKKKCGALGVAEVRRLKQLEDENQRLKQLVAELNLDREMLQDVSKKSSEAESETRSGIAPHVGISSERAPLLWADRNVPHRMVLPVEEQT